MVILGMSWLARHNPEIDWRTGEVKMTRCPEECGKQWRPEQGKSGWEKQKEEEAKKEVGRKQEEKEKKKKQKKGKTVEVKRVAEEWEIWNKEEEAAKSEEEAKKMVPEKFHKYLNKWMIKNNYLLPLISDCYDSMLKGLSKELTLVLSDTRELDRVPNTK